ncbi:hypothetical protein CHLNCDRAFT_137073 [Chlorella variabilis]|uniref:Chitin-binding type-1 domain-containing protein n=1 Tax=Chlorella variabilis TaxID=554065 RepID=E1ZLX9_CHLVA|nr:hypothetical protein CHLNCDRAFT_137073 [Chlorella variabilis]EFN53345.1 hypothetical protein CHLNCDRAFT_137073 [Chlorella variabilis]|eukprot:XP_005845447.1 hypothetical protein CHLNCDRAFT_137073 [Chlorella variabilis]
MRVHTLLLLCLAAAAAAPASAAKKCGVRNRNKPCADRRACCNKKGYCGKSAPYCAAINCVSGPCQTWEDAIQTNERPIPSYPVQFNVLAYDDTKAVLAALKAASAAAARLGVPKTGMGNEGQAGVAVLLPAGRYRITQFIELTQSNVAVRGEGVDKTVLYFPRALQHVYGNLMAWSYMGGFLTCRGRRYDSAVTQFQLARVTGAARKGDRRLSVDTTRGITAGRWIRLYATKPLATGPRRQLLGEEQEGRERVKVQVEPWEAEAEMELWEEEEEPQPQPISRRQLTEKQQATSEDDGGSSSGSSKKKGSKRRMCGRKGDRHRCRRIRKAMKEWEKEAEALGLGQPEVPGASSSGEEGDEQGGEKAPATSAAGTLDAYIFFNNAVDSGKSPFGGERIRFISRVSAVGSGWIELERPLPYDLRPEWQVAVYSFEHSVQHVGYEDFTVEFQWDTYPAHFGAKGYNAFRFQSCANAWIRNVRIIDADNGAESINCDLITMQNITLEFTRNRGNKGVGYSSGHHGLWAAASSLVHFTDLTFKGRFIHDLTLDVWSQECAYTNSRGVDMSMDMHRGGVHNNLWSNIDVGLGSRTFQSSGAASKGAHAAANNTWWNIYASSRPTASLAIPDCGYGPLLNYVGGFGPPAKGAAGIAGPGSPAGTPTPLFPAYCTPGVAWWVEQKRAGAALSPPDLFPAMVATRQQRLAIPAVRRPKN